MSAAEAVKACRGCGEVKPLSAYHRKGPGRDSRCKPCKVAQVITSQHDHRPKYLQRKQVYSAIARAREAGAPGHLTSAEWRGLLDLFGHACGWCGAAGVPLELDHVYPLARGGANDATNCAPACAGCNSAKRAQLPLTFFFCLDLPF